MLLSSPFSNSTTDKPYRLRLTISKPIHRRRKKNTLRKYLEISFLFFCSYSRFINIEIVYQILLNDASFSIYLRAYLWIYLLLPRFLPFQSSLIKSRYVYAMRWKSFSFEYFHIACTLCVHQSQAWTLPFLPSMSFSNTLIHTQLFELCITDFTKSSSFIVVAFFLLLQSVFGV